jgi:hypothetical protein
MTDLPQVADLPRAVAIYLSTPRQQVGEILDELFTTDAAVHDEGQTHLGIGAIQAWNGQVAAAFTFTRTITSATVWPGAAIVTVHLEGDFPGSPVELHHHFSLADEKIMAMTICL